MNAEEKEKEELLKLAKELRQVEEERARGIKGKTLDEVYQEWERLIEEL